MKSAHVKYSKKIRSCMNENKKAAILQRTEELENESRSLERTVQKESSAELERIGQARREIQGLAKTYEQKIADFKAIFYDPDTRKTLSISYVKSYMKSLKELHERTQGVLGRCTVPTQEFMIKLEDNNGLQLRVIPSNINENLRTGEYETGLSKYLAELERENYRKTLLNDRDNKWRHTVIAELENILMDLRQRDGSLAEYEERIISLQAKIRAFIAADQKKRVERCTSEIDGEFQALCQFVQSEGDRMLERIRKQREEVQSASKAVEDKIADFKATLCEPATRSMLTTSYVKPYMAKLKEVVESAQHVLQTNKVPKRKFCMKLEDENGLRVRVTRSNGKRKLFPTTDKGRKRQRRV